MPRLVIDDLEVEVPEGSKVIDAAERLGIVIPRFCYHEALGAVGACRMCAVKFIQGPFKGVQMSCMVDAQDGMVVSTTDEEAVQFRKRVIELLMVNHPLDCPVCDEGGQCLLQDETWSGGHGVRRFRGDKRTYNDQYLGPYIQHEMNRCIHCYRCSRFYQEFAGYKDLGPMQTASRLYFGRFSDGKLESPFSGNLVDVCPTGVYTDKTARFKVRRWDLQRAPSLCSGCSLGCNTTGNAHYRGIMRVEARYNRDVNGYFICDAGRFGFSYTNGGAGHGARPWYPKVDGSHVSAPAAFEKAREALGKVTEADGPGAVAVVGSHRNSLETQCVLKRICRTKNWSGPSFFFDPARRVKTRAAVECLDAENAASMREIEKADFVIIAGADLLNEAAMTALAVRQAARKEAPVLVIDPRRVSLPFGFEHIAAAPGEIEFYLGMLTRRAVRAYADKFETEAADFYKALAGEKGDGELPAKIGAILEKPGSCKRPVIICGTDVTRETTPAFAADCAALLSAAGKDALLLYVLAGAGSFSSALLAGTDGLDFAHTVEEIERGAVRALIVVESDPFRYYPNRQRLERAVSMLDVLIAIDYFPTETVKCAGIFLPASTIFETGSTYVNQEGRIQYAHQVHTGGLPIWGEEHPPRIYGELVPAGEHLPAWKAMSEISGVPIETAAAGEASLGDVIASEQSAFEGLGGGNYPADGIRILPVKSARKAWGSRGAGFVKEAGKTDALELLMVEWMFGTSEYGIYSDSLDASLPEPCLFMNSKDALRAGLSDGDRVSIDIGHAAVRIVLSVTDRTAEGTLIMPRHKSIDWQEMENYPVWVPIEKIVRI